MLRRIILGVVLIGLAAVSSGCVAVVAAGGAVGWQAGKIISEERVSRDRAVEAALDAFRAEKIKLTEKVIKTHATQLRGEYPDGANVYVDVLPVGEKSCRIEIRVGIGQKKVSRDLLDKIKNRL